MSGLTVVTGATGTIGGHLARRILGSGGEVRVLVRDPARAQELEDAGAEVAQGDFMEPGQLEGFDGADAAFLMVPIHEDMVPLGRRLHESAAAAGVRRAVRLSVSTPILEYDAFLGRAHRELDRDFLARFPNGGAIVRPEGFMENLLASVGPIRAGRLPNVGGEARTPFIAAEDVAASIDALLRGEGPCQGIHDLTGPDSLTWGEVAAAFQQELGHPVEFVDVPLDAYMAQVRQAGLPAVIVDVLESLARFRLEDSPKQPTDEVERLTGRPPTALKEWIRQHRGAFLPDPATSA
jgi:uncharacterized protein YbjT (DUF2867 family)